MMEHPIHLHGLWSELENGHGEYRPYKHTFNVKPGEMLSYLVSADTPGRWAYHCHLLYHMEMGMFREVRVPYELSGSFLLPSLLLRWQSAHRHKHRPLRTSPGPRLPW